MAKAIVTYFITALFFIAFMGPFISSVVFLFSDNSKEIVFEIIDSETEESNESGENEGKSNSENEKSADEKLKHQKDKYSILHLSSAIQAKCLHTDFSYINIIRAVPTPPPES